MGIRGAQTFIEKLCPRNCCYEVSIEQLVEDYKGQTGGCEPVIVFDGSSCLKSIYGGLDWVSGGQYKEYIEKLGEFIKAFKQLGVHLVFYFGGGTVSSKRKEWIKRSLEKLENMYQMFDHIAHGVSVADLPQKLYHTPLEVSLFSRHYIQHIFGCEVHQAVDETDTEIAHFARENNALAIFGQDSDFLIYEGGTYYLSARHFNVHTMRTMNYDRKEFARHLGLDLSQLPLFATLAGNDHVSFVDLEPFHRSICRRYYGGYAKTNFQTLFPALVKYIRQFSVGNSMFAALPNIARESLNDSKAATVLAESIRSYLPATKIVERMTAPNHPKWDAILRRAEVLHRSNYNVKTVFVIMNGEPVEFLTALEDYREKDLPPSDGLLRPMRRNIYGILFDEKPSDVAPQFVLEWCVEGSDSLNEPSRVNPVPPLDPHPGLLALWSEDRSEETQNLRWQLFAHAVSPRLDHVKLKCLPNNIILPTSVMFYLVERKILHPWELDALIATVATLPSISIDSIASLPSDPVDLRAARISSIYLRSLEITFTLLSVCGYPLARSQAFLHPYFDGKLFQEKYRLAKERVPHETLCGHETPSLELFQDIRQILFHSSATYDKKCHKCTRY